MRSVTPQFELCGSSVIPEEPSGTAGFPCGRQVRQDGAGEALAAASSALGGRCVTGGTYPPLLLPVAHSVQEMTCDFLW